MTPKPPPTRARRRQHLRLGAVAIVFALGAAACGNDDEASIPQSGETGATDAEDPGTGATEGDAVTVTAEDIAFDVERIEANAGEELTITFDNDDADVPHNLHVQAGSVDEKTEITPGPDTQTLRITIDEPGTYTFICDVHPNMTGEVVVS